MKRKYADYYWTVKKEKEGWVWRIYANFFDKEPVQSSLDNSDEDDKYLDTSTAAAGDAIHAIQDYYS